MKFPAAVAIVMVASGLGASVAAAASLAAQLDDLLRREGFTPSNTVVPTLVRTVARSADFPTAATGPDFAYEYRPETGTPERSRRPLSPVLVEAAQTVGRHVLQIGGSMLWTSFNRLEGGLLRNTEADFVLGAPLPEGGTLSIPGTLAFDQFRIEDFVFSTFVTYGITERWDVGLVVPAVRTSLRARGRSQVRIEGENVPLDRFDIDDSKLGVGDILLRTKYVLDRVQRLQVAPTLTLRLPSGNPDNFQGIGDTTITPGAALTYWAGRLGLFANVGFEFNAGDFERSAFRYGLAASVRVLEAASLVAEVTGTSTVTANAFSVPLGAIEEPAEVPRADSVDGSVGFKARFLPRAVGYVSVIFPLTKDGVTAPVTPIGGIEISF